MYVQYVSNRKKCIMHFLCIWIVNTLCIFNFLNEINYILLISLGLINKYASAYISKSASQYKKLHFRISFKVIFIYKTFHTELKMLYNFVIDFLLVSLKIGMLTVQFSSRGWYKVPYDEVHIHCSIYRYHIYINI